MVEFQHHFNCLSTTNTCFSSMPSTYPSASCSRLPRRRSRCVRARRGEAAGVHRRVQWCKTRPAPTILKPQTQHPTSLKGYLFIHSTLVFLHFNAEEITLSSVYAFVESRGTESLPVTTFRFFSYSPPARSPGTQRGTSSPGSRPTLVISQQLFSHSTRDSTTLAQQRGWSRETTTTYTVLIGSGITTLLK